MLTDREGSNLVAGPAGGQAGSAATPSRLPSYVAGLHRVIFGLLDRDRAAWKWSIGCLAIFLLVAMPNPARAHPHVWVTASSEVLYGPDGLMTGVRHAWTFDDMFSAYAVQGIHHAKKGQYTREELSSLAEVNVTSLKEYGFFTYAKADGKKLKFSEPTDYWLEYKDSFLTLHFTLPLKDPASGRAFLIEVYDPSTFVNFDLAKERPVTLSGAPEKCQLFVELPREPTAAEQLRMRQFDQNPLNPFDTFGQVFSNKIRVVCP
jgi:ABC-type uncharacterized transport system substrate-binding protein